MSTKIEAQPRLVLVEWEDATLLDSETWVQTPEEHEYKPCIHQTAGWLLSDTKAGIIIAGTWQPGCTSVRDQIPRGMIRRITFLRAVK
jgi:hypothetical protein